MVDGLHAYLYQFILYELWIAERWTHMKYT